MAQVSTFNQAAVHTTVELPPDLVHRAEQFVSNGGPPTLSALIVTALEHFIVHLEARIAGRSDVPSESLAWTLLSQDAFAEDWNSEEDAIYNDWEKRYGLHQG